MEHFSQYVISFLEKYDANTNTLNHWNSEEIQSGLKDHLNKKNKQKVKKVKKVKDVNEPKRGKTSYLYFCSDERDDVKNHNPEMNAKEITSELGKRWNNLKLSDPSKIIEYEKKADIDRERYKNAKKLYQSSNQDISKKNKIKIKKIPKSQVKLLNVQPAIELSSVPVELLTEQSEQLLSPFEKFCKSNRKQLKQNFPDLSSKEITKKIKILWKDLSETEKDSFRK